jgi:hypothetical protein
MCTSARASVEVHCARAVRVAATSALLFLVSLACSGDRPSANPPSTSEPTPVEVQTAAQSHGDTIISTRARDLQLDSLALHFLRSDSAVLSPSLEASAAPYLNHFMGSPPWGPAEQLLVLAHVPAPPSASQPTAGWSLVLIAMNRDSVLSRQVVPVPFGAGYAGFLVPLGCDYLRIEVQLRRSDGTLAQRRTRPVRLVCGE